MAKPKIKHTITKKEWDNKHKDFKLMGKDGIPYIMAYDSKIGTHLVPVKIVKEEMDESVGAELDLIKQSSKDVKDFIKKVFRDSDFRAMKNDKDFVKYLKSMYEGIEPAVNEGFKSEYKGNDGIVWKKGNSRGGVTNFTPYYKGHDIDKGGHNFKTEKELKDFIKNYILSRDQYHKYKFESVNEAKYKVGDTITVTLKGGKKVIKGKVEKINPLKIRTSPSDTVVLGNHLIKKVVKESVNEGKYNYKADALTAYFKGKIDAKELDKIARDDFKSGIATKKELSNFLSNKFTQDVMSDTYGIPAGTLIKRVRGLMKFAEGKDDGVPQGYNPMVEDKKQIKDLVKKVKHEKLFYDVLATMEKKYGKRQYRIWLEKSLKDFGVNPKHYDYRTNAAAEEKLFQLGK